MVKKDIKKVRKVVIMNPYRFACSKCGERFTYYINLKRHENICLIDDLKIEVFYLGVKRP